jgi:glutathione synthase/RimK-type ligase-like ATP-grasp enzyme
MSPVHILFENPDWMPPLRQALESRGLPFVEHFLDGGTLDTAEPPPDGVWINRMSPSSHTRGHQAGVVFARELLGWLEAHGRPVINGTRAFTLELSKVQQYAALHRHGIRTPRTRAVVGGAEALKREARAMGLPFITKHNQGGKGLGVQLFRDLDAFDAFVDSGELEPSPDGVMLLQQYIQAPEPFITRVEIVDGRFLYALMSNTEQGFELCPADACQIGDLACPVGDTGLFGLRESITAEDPLVQQLIAFCAAEQLGLAGIEFIEDADGTRYVYDVNGTSNYNSEVEARYGFSGMGAVADLAKRLLEGSS